MTTPITKIEDEKFLEQMRLYMNAFYYSTTLPARINPHTLKKWVLGYHYNSKSGASTGFSGKIFSPLPIRYAGKVGSPYTDGRHIFFNHTFFTHEFYADKLGVPDEYVPQSAALMYNAISAHEASHCKIMQDEGYYNAGDMIKKSVLNMLSFSKSDYNLLVQGVVSMEEYFSLSPDEIKKRYKAGNPVRPTKRMGYLMLALNAVEDNYIERYLLPTYFAYTRRLMKFYANLLFGYASFTNNFGEDQIEPNAIHYLRNPDKKFSRYLLRSSEWMVTWSEIINKISLSSTVTGRSRVAWALYESFVEWHEETQGSIDEADEEMTDEEKEELASAVEEMLENFGASGETDDTGEEEEGSEELESFNDEAEEKDKEATEELQEDQNNNRWMEKSITMNPRTAEMGEWRGHSGEETPQVIMLPQMKAFSKAFQYSKRAKRYTKRGQEKGIIDSANLHRIGTDGKVFRKARKNRRGKSKPRVVIMNDVSGSTHSRLDPKRYTTPTGYLCTDLLSTGYSLHEVLRSAGVPVASLAHSTEYDDEGNDGSVFYEIASNRMNLTVGGGMFNHTDTREAYQKVAEGAAYSGNCDGAALRHSAEIIQDGTNSQKIIVIIADGEPAESHIMVDERGKRLSGRDSLMIELERVRSTGVVVVAFSAVAHVHDKLVNLFGEEFTFKAFGDHTASEAQRMLQSVVYSY